MTQGIVPEPNLTIVPTQPVHGVSVSGDWAAVKRYADAARQFSRAQVACQVMAGLELLALRKQHQISQGKRPDLVQGPSWDDLVAEHAGVSRETSRRWCQMAEAVKPRLKKLSGVGDLFRELLARPITELTAEQQHLLEEAVHKATDGYTQTEFLRELGLAKSPSSPKGGDLGGRRPKKGVPSEEELLALPRNDWVRIVHIFQASGVNFTALPDAEIEAQIATLSEQLQARREWLSTPKAKRTPQVAEAISRKLVRL